ncbi:hypothetical protein [Pseudoalteromonas mariniglutinosa]|uniref:hypothetical protein n=1 Tax=Pseudoalteromonas mariniglutinosa TaxID=206042 RepID=UPI00384B32F2
MNQLLCGLLLLCSLTVIASEHFSDHESFCLELAEENCLMQINTHLAASQIHSIKWYKIKSYQLDYYYDKGNYAALKAAIDPYIDDQTLPKVFKVQTYFYYAKALRYFNDNQQAKVYADKAFNELNMMYQSFNNPLRMVELANLQYVFGDLTLASDILKQAQSRFEKSKDPIFHFELHSNKGHVFHALGDIENAAKSRQLAVEWILTTDHKSKKSVALSNLARTYQLLFKYQLAEQYYVDSLLYLDADEDASQLSIYTLRLAEISWQANNNKQAIKWLNKVEKRYLQRNHLLLYEQLNADLAL